MKRHIVLLSILLFIWNTRVVSQLITINDNLPTTAVLLQFKNGSMGTGIFISDSKFVYLITARHVLIESNAKEYSLIDDTLNVISYRSDAYFDSQDTLVLYLNNLILKKQIAFDSKYDMAVIRIGSRNSDSVTHNYFEGVFRKNRSTRINPITLSEMATFDETKLGSEVYLIGYPKSLQLLSSYDFDFNRPLLRKGILAGKDVKYSNLIIDCPTYKGNSGGPVFQIVNIKGELKLVLIGLVSRLIALGEYWENKYYGNSNLNIINSGYTVVVPIDFALSLINKFK